MKSKMHRMLHGFSGKLFFWLFITGSVFFLSQSTVLAAPKGISANVIPSVNISGATDYVVVPDQSSASQLQLSISWNPYELNRSKWEIWLLAYDPDGFKYFNLKTMSWLPGFLPTYTGKNINFLPTMLPLNGINLSGKSVVFFAIADKKSDKKITQATAFTDKVSVIISGDLTTTCTSFDYGPWSECINNSRIREVLVGYPESCSGGNPIVSEYCQPTVPDCTSWFCDQWDVCQANGIQLCFLYRAFPEKCVGVPPLLTQTCIPNCTECAYTPWGECLSSGLMYRNLLNKYPPNCTGCLDQESMACVPQPGACLSWVCDIWEDICGTNGIQYCLSQHGLPQGCTGTTTALTRNCVPEPVTCTSWTCDAWGACQTDNTQTCQSATGSPPNCSGTPPPLTQVCQYQDTPQLVIDHWPTYGTTENLTGHITGVSDPTQYRIIPYIEVESLFWPKPTLDTPYCPVAANGTFTCDVTTGGNDIYADRIVLFLVKNDFTTPSCFPCYELPIVSAFDSKTFDRLPDVTLNFAGRIWKLKRADYPAGPGPMQFCDQSQCVWVDSAGLHLTIKKIGGVWKGSEIILNESLGYGTYVLQTNSRVDNFDPNVVFGFFTWDPIAKEYIFREIDIEIAKWGNPGIIGNAQFVKQFPTFCNACPGCGDNCSRYEINQSDGNLKLTYYLVWQPGFIELRVYRNHHGMSPLSSDLVASKKWTTDIVAPGQENIRMNFWLYNGSAPTNGQNHSILLTDFQYQSETPVWNDTLPDNPGITIDSCGTYNDSTSSAKGHVTGINPDDYKVAVYIQVRGNWWTKPYWSTPLTSINANGKWECDIITGGVDYEATQVRAYLVPNGYSPPSVGGGSTLPAELDQNSIAKSDCMR